MLKRLVIHDVVLIEKLTLELAPGLNVFTGETGAGKSILLDALGLALGDRSDASLIRTGAAQASVTAEFNLPLDHPVINFSREHGLAVEENTFVLRRVVGKDGKSRAFLNDQSVGISLLKQLGEYLLEIHGQFETHGLLDSATHRGLLDSFANQQPLKEKLINAYKRWQDADERHRNAATDRHRARAEEDFLRAAVQELNDLNPKTGEAAQLAEQRTSLQHREKIVEAVKAAVHAISGDRGASSSLAIAGKAIARIADKGAGLNELLATIDRAGHETAEAGNALEHYMASFDADPNGLDRIEQRLFALRAVARKHNVQVEELTDLQQDLANRLAMLNDHGDQLSVLAKIAHETKAVYKELADELADKRRKAAYQLEKAIRAELPPLKLQHAVFKVEITPLPEDQWSAEGTERIVFAAATNPGSPTGSLQKIASGGELARFMLALKVVLVAQNPVPTLVFDEVDTGIGGATASAVGERLARLAQHVQILVVTHSPQVAARGKQHFRVAKLVKDDQATTTVEILTAKERQEEIARMLSGAQITDPARQAALSLLQDSELPVVAKKPARAS
jgi:DNA repair protein RecN (Recombination protein N)